jgi:hypothetical protein
MSEGQLGGDEVGGWRRSQVDEAFYSGRALGKSASRDYYRLTNPLSIQLPFNAINITLSLREMILSNCFTNLILLDIDGCIPGD